LVITELLFGFTAITADRVCPMKCALSGDRSNGDFRLV
jgi:hypothetical protein